MAAVDETILPMPSPIVTARHARSTVLLGSLAGVRAGGRIDEYSNRLTPTQREVLLNMVAGAWVPMEIAYAHYEACEALGYSPDQQVANGRATFDRTSGTLLGTVIRMAKEAGVSPWNVLPHFQRFWERGYDGGGIQVVKVGPKEARVDVVQVRLCDLRYYRNALRGLVTGVVELFCQKAYVHERQGPRPPSSSSMRVQWA